MTDSTEKKALDLISGLVSLAFPSIAGPAQAVRLLVEDAMGNAHEITEDGVSVVQEREQEAGRSANKAAKLAGMREAIERQVAAHTSYITPSAPTRAELVDAIMTEVARRMP